MAKPIENKQFDREYLCYSFSLMDQMYHDPIFARQNMSNQIILPVRAMERLINFKVKSPYCFRIYTKTESLYVGVIQFTANEKLMYVPDWMIDKLGIEDGDRVQIVSVDIPTATKVIFEGSDEFMKGSNPKVVIEVKLRHHNILRLGQVIKIKYARKSYKLKIIKLEPEDVCSIIDADVQLEMRAAEP